MAAATLYAGKINSPPTFLTAPYTVGDGLLNVDDTGVFPAAPNIVVVAASATDITAVTYIYTGIGVNQLTGVTLLEGTDKDWPINTPCARNFTDYDWQGVVDRFHVTTGHKHTAATGDGPQLDHGQLGGLTDDDHVRYFDKDCSKPITGTPFVRDVDDSAIGFYGGSGYAGEGAGFTARGKNSGYHPGYLEFYVANAAKTGMLLLMYVAGNTDTPTLNMNSHRIVGVLAPTTAGDALIYQAWADWTPTLTWATATPTGVSTSARWNRIGNIVFFVIRVGVTDSNATTGLTITLPVTVSASGGYYTFSGYQATTGATPVISDPYAWASASATTLVFQNFVTGIDGSAIVIRVSGFYEV